MKRITSFLAAVLALVCFASVAVASNSAMSPLASPTIAKRTAYICAGDNPGEIDIDFSISPNAPATSLGVSSIVIHKPDGSTYTVLGSVGNGFIGSGNGHAGTYTYKGESGKSYYAEVTFFATIGSTTDSKTVLTRSATAR